MQHGLQASLEKPSGGPGPPTAAGDRRYDPDADVKVRVSCPVPCLSWSCCSCLVAQSCPTLREPMDCSPPGSSVHGILQARILAWVAISFSRASSRPRERILSPTL